MRHAATSCTIRLVSPCASHGVQSSLYVSFLLLVSCYLLLVSDLVVEGEWQASEDGSTVCRRKMRKPCGQDILTSMGSRSQWRKNGALASVRKKGWHLQVWLLQAVMLLQCEFNMLALRYRGDCMGGRSLASIVSQVLHYHASHPTH